MEDDAPAVLSALSRMPDDLLGVIALRSVSNVVAWPGMTAEELQGVVSCRAVSSVDLAGRTVRGRNVRVDRPGVSIRNGALLLSGSPVRVEHLAPGGDRGASIGSAEEDEDEEGPNEPAEAAAERNVLSDTEQSDGSTGAPGEGVDGSDTARVLASDAPPADGVERAEGGSGSGGAGGGFDGVVDLIHGLGGNEDGEESGECERSGEQERRVGEAAWWRRERRLGEKVGRGRGEGEKVETGEGSGGEGGAVEGRVLTACC